MLIVGIWHALANAMAVAVPPDPLEQDTTNLLGESRLSPRIC